MTLFFFLFLADSEEVKVFDPLSNIGVDNKNRQDENVFQQIKQLFGKKYPPNLLENVNFLNIKWQFLINLTYFLNV